MGVMEDDPVVQNRRFLFLEMSQMVVVVVGRMEIIVKEMMLMSYLPRVNQA